MTAAHGPDAAGTRQKSHKVHTKTRVPGACHHGGSIQSDDMATGRVSSGGIDESGFHGSINSGER